MTQRTILPRVMQIFLSGRSRALCSSDFAYRGANADSHPQRVSVIAQIHDLGDFNGEACLSKTLNIVSSVLADVILQTECLEALGGVGNDGSS